MFRANYFSWETLYMPRDISMGVTLVISRAVRDSSFKFNFMARGGLGGLHCSYLQENYLIVYIQKHGWQSKN